MKEKRLLQRLRKAVISASSHKGMACAHAGDTCAQGSEGRQNCKYLCTCAQICVTTQGHSLRVKSSLMTSSESFTVHQFTNTNHNAEFKAAILENQV